MAGYQMQSKALSNEGRSLLARQRFATNDYRDPTFFPLQAAQIADAEGAQGNGQPQPYRTPSPSTAGGYDAAWHKKHDAAVAAEQDRYDKTLAGYDQRAKTAMDFITPDASKAGFTMSPIDTYEANHPGQKFNLDQRFDLAKLSAGLSGDKLRVMENASTEYPDQRLFADLEAKRGSGSQAGLESPMAAPAMAVPQGGGYDGQQNVVAQSQPQAAQGGYDGRYGVRGGQIGPAKPSAKQIYEGKLQAVRDKKAAEKAAADAKYNASIAGPTAQQTAANTYYDQYPQARPGYTPLSARSVAQRTIARRKAQTAYAAD
jgi:Tfp pilus assembly protein PilW